MKYLALVFLVSAAFAGSASANGVVTYSHYGVPVLIMDKDKAQNYMRYNRMMNHSVIISGQNHWIMRSTIWPMH